jgi:BirA family biotin operon repressor/biotin-[acetyl-CoA-carboxylase] ligase
MSFFQPEQVRAHTFIEYVEYHAALESTNSLAVELRNELYELAPALVLTDEQSAGRGRGIHTWWSAAGALTCSVVLDADRDGPAAESRPLVALAAGLAARASVAELVPNYTVQTKWPNDVLVGDQKIGGILSEQHSTGSGSVLIIGIGLNVNNSLATAPDDVRQRATSVFDLTGHSVDLTETLVRLLNHLRHALDQVCRNPVETAQESGRFDRLTGHEVKIQTPTELLAGKCQGIANDGALLLKIGDAVREVRAGNVLAFS